MKNYLLSCDWGTSSFRLRLINQSNHQLMGEITSSEGIASTFTTWQQGEPNGVARASFYQQRLTQHIHQLSKNVAMNLDGIDLVISGMASSSIGMTELPYATLPFPFDGSQARLKRFAGESHFPHETLLISGVRSQHDVMRGEETQLIGLLALSATDPHAVDDTIILFPGTHSKHLYIQHGQLTDFQTFMTGEVFNLMAQHSILQDSVAVAHDLDYLESDVDAFKSGVHETGSHALLTSLFRVRTNQLFNVLTRRQNAFYLSGLLIGSELRTLLEKPTGRLMLCSGTHLSELYTLAMRELQLSDRTTFIPADLLDKATVAGQMKIIQNQRQSVSR